MRLVRAVLVLCVSLFSCAAFAATGWWDDGDPAGARCNAHADWQVHACTDYPYDSAGHWNTCTPTATGVQYDTYDGQGGTRLGGATADGAPCNMDAEVGAAATGPTDAEVYEACLGIFGVLLTAMASVWGVKQVWRVLDQSRGEA